MVAEVEVGVTSEDVRIALAESFDRVTRDPLGEPGPGRWDVTQALNNIAAFLNALTDAQIGLLLPAQRSTAASYLSKQAERFATVEGK
jgi:hypothetical protein